MTIAVLTSHPIQYYAPLFRELAKHADVEVFFAYSPSPQQQADAGFSVPFEWDVDLLSGYKNTFLRNVSRRPGVDSFAGCDTPEIGERLSECRAETLLVTGWNLKCYWQGILAAKRRGIQVIGRGDSHLETPRAVATRLVKRALYPPLLRAFDAAAYVGTKNLAYWRHYGYPSDRLFFSPHCVDHAHFASGATDAARNDLRSKLHIPVDATVALFAGRLVPLKRPGDLIEAGTLVRNLGIDLHVVIAGSGELEPLLRRQAVQAGVPTHFLGFQNQSEMPAVYAASDMLVLPSGRETWGLVANEALACQRPIVVSDACGCAPDLAADGKAGLVMPTGDIAALADRVRQIREAPPRGISEKAARYSIEYAVTGILEAASNLSRAGRARD